MNNFFPLSRQRHWKYTCLPVFNSVACFVLKIEQFEFHCSVFHNSWKIFFTRGYCNFNDKAQTQKYDQSFIIPFFLELPPLSTNKRTTLRNSTRSDNCRHVDMVLAEKWEQFALLLDNSSGREKQKQRAPGARPDWAVMSTDK